MRRMIAAGELRMRLVDELERTGALSSTAARAAFLAVPRELFVPELAEAEGLAAVYQNAVVVTKRDGRGVPLSSSSEPQVMAAMLEHLELSEGMRILEIGAGSGYNAALLKTLVGQAGRVTTIDIDPELARKARMALRAGGFEARVVCADGSLGYPDEAPFDRIVVTASSARVPVAWRDQLAEGGLLELPLRMTASGVQAIATFRRVGSRLVSVAVVPGRFMPLRGDELGEEQPPTLTVYHQLRGRKKLTQTQLFGDVLTRLSDEERLRLQLLSDPRVTSAGSRSATWSLGLYLSLEIPADLLVQRFADLSVGLVGHEGRGLALVEGRWHEGQRTSEQRVLAYGDDDAERRLHQLLEVWRSRGCPGHRELEIAIDFSGSRSRIAHGWR
jgi:methyltransferase of FxLD system